MANTLSAMKRIRQEQKRHARNQAVKSRMRTFIKRAQDAIERGEREEAVEAVRQAVSEIDRAAKKGTIHANNAARHKSRLMQSLYQELNASL